MMASLDQEGSYRSLEWLHVHPASCGLLTYSGMRRAYWYSLRNRGFVSPISPYHGGRRAAVKYPMSCLVGSRSYLRWSQLP